MPHVVYLSRGHGYGHAARDRAIAAALRALRPDLVVEVASYGTGLEFYRAHADPCVDLRIDDDDDQGSSATISVATFLATRRHADLVVANEMFTAPSVCDALGLRSVLLTHWFFTELGAPAMDAAMAHAGSVILLDFEQAHRVPARLRRRVTFTGAVAEPFRTDRVEARRALRIDATEYLVVLATGAIYPDKAAHLRAVVAKGLRAWRTRPTGGGRLVVLSGLPPTVDDPSVRWVPWTDRPDLYYRAADVVLTTGTFGTICALARNEVPTVAVVGGQNPVDRLHAEFFAAQGFLTAVDASVSDATLGRAVAAARPDGDRAALRWAAPADVARRLADLVA
nr:hypothetical protein [Micromonospora sp. DSM 115978]